jgi:hypothetical protein
MSEYLNNPAALEMASADAVSELSVERHLAGEPVDGQPYNVTIVVDTGGIGYASLMIEEAVPVGWEIADGDDYAADNESGRIRWALGPEASGMTQLNGSRLEYRVIPRNSNFGFEGRYALVPSKGRSVFGNTARSHEEAYNIPEVVSDNLVRMLNAVNDWSSGRASLSYALGVIGSFIG